jgi:FAD/FMN-containing dehydrogenase
VEGERAVRPLKAFGTPVVDLIGPQPFTAHQTLLDATQPPGRQCYWKSEYLPGLSDEAIETSIAYAASITSPFSLAQFFQLGGAAGRISAGDTAYRHRAAQFVHLIASAWEDPAESERHIAWTREFWAAMQPLSAGGGYVNFISADEGEDRVRAAYGPNYERLVALKRQYDPTNLFRVNQNIKPTI